MIGTQIGRYRIDGELGRGGMGVVYRGTQVTLDRTVAIKMLPAHLAGGDNQERFRREALTLARLAHPNIVHIYDVEEQDGHSFIMMEHVGGGSLGDQMRTGTPFAPGRAVEIMAPILSALHAAHLAGVVHRDIKPDNILFTESGRPKLTDFGVAHMRDSGSRTRTGVMLGTPYYMSPEQAQGRPVTATTDLYAVGVVLYEMLSGHVPFTGEDPLSVALKHVQEVPRPLREWRPDLPVELCDLVHRALQKDPTTRFTSAAVMQDALESGHWAPGRTSLDPGASGSRSATGSLGATPVPVPLPMPSISPATDAPGADPAHSIVSSTGRGVAVAAGIGRQLASWLGTTGWRGYPRAFWLGAAALALTLGWAGADLMGRGAAQRGDSPPPPVDPIGAVASDPSAGDAERTPAVVPGAAVGSPTRPVSGRDPGTVSPRLNEEDRAALRDLVRGQPNDTVPVGAEGTDTDPDILDRIETSDPGPLTLDDLRRNDVAEDVDAPPTDRDQLRSIIDRQLSAVQRSNRALFLQDFHPDVRPDAAEEFDLAAAGARDIRSTISNLSIEFPEPDHAFVTFDVDVSFIVRADGRTVRQSYEEMWDLRREGDRWWIIAWN